MRTTDFFLLLSGILVAPNLTPRQRQLFASACLIAATVSLAEQLYRVFS